MGTEDDFSMQMVYWVFGWTSSGQLPQIAINAMEQGYSNYFRLN
jgi:hypothetical protein